MIDQWMNQAQALLNPQAISEKSRQFAQSAQVAVAQGARDAQELAQLEMENISRFALARKPEDFYAALVSAYEKRQGFASAKITRAIEVARQYQESIALQVQGQSEQASQQASQAVDTVFGAARQSLEMAESATKSAIKRGAASASKRK